MTDKEKSLQALSPKKRALLELIEKERKQKAAASKGVPKRADAGSFPMSFAQRRLWFQAHYAPQSPVYNVATAFRMEGALDPATLDNAFTAVVNRHEVLRSRYVEENGEPKQVIDAPYEHVLTRIDLSHVPEPDRYSEALREVSNAARTGFDLETGPLFRVHLYRLSATEHVLSLCIHHIVSDGWSFGVLFHEVGEAYEGRLSASSPLPLQYSDFACWQTDSLAGESLTRQLDYWKRQLSGAPTVLQISNRPRPALQSFVGEKHFRKLDRELSTRVTAFANEHGVTKFVLLLAAFQVLLYRESGQPDVVVGTPVSRRNRTELEPLIGCFSNVLPLRSRLTEDPTVVDLLKTVRGSVLDAHENQELPFEKLVEELKLERVLSHNPVFQVGFALHEAGAQPLQLPDLTITRIEVDTKTAKWDLILEVLPENAELCFVLEYNTDLFDSERTARMLGHLEVLLQGMIDSPELRVSELPVLTSAEWQQMVIDWNSTATEYPRNTPLPALFEAQVSKTPEAVAAQFGKSTVTYRELNQRANQMAHFLQRQGVRHGDFVAICVERSIEMLVATLGILKAGAAYVPLDPDYPADRLGFMLRDCGASLLLTQRRLVAKVPSDRSVICLDDEWANMAKESTENLGVPASSEDVAYVMYTSGSTGIPKGIQVVHHGIARLVLNTDYVALGPHDRIAQASNTSFDASTFEIWGALLNGARLVGFSKDVVLSAEELASELRAQKITTLFLTPALFNQHVRQIPDIFRTLTTVLCGGEAMDVWSSTLVLKNGPPQRLLNVYGPTENTTFTTTFQVKEVSSDMSAIPIGRPIANTTTYVLDRHLQPVPVGVVGELFIGGDGLAKGYLNREELDKEKFVFVDFGGEKKRLYRSGDLARYTNDGDIEFLGRIDGQVKIRGFRIELGEIAATLLTHHSVQQAVVVVREPSPGDKRLIAYVVPKQHQVVDSGELRSHLKTTLPEYMLPADYVFLDGLPLNANGKVDRDALPAYTESAKSGSGTQSLPPRTQLERQIAEIWQEVLQRQDVSRTDNFFDIGGHSLLLTKVHSRIQKKLGRKLTIIELFQYPTISSFAAHLGDTEPAEQVVPEHDGKSRTREAIAIIAMAGRFPGSNSVDELWRNLREGREGLRQFSDEELLAAGVDAERLRDPRFVKAGSTLASADEFDAAFFGMNAREADVTDPQQRLLLETAHQVLERAGCDPQVYTGRIGVFAGATMSTYFTRNLLTNPSAIANQSELQLTIGNDKDFIATRLAYKLNLKGPAVTVQTACSTSLVAVHSAVEALLNGQCEIALAGGVSVRYPQGTGYLYQEQGIGSPDGHCRSFDHKSAGTVPGDGVGMVVMKRLSDAIADGDQIEAVILGTSINNDGSDKVGYTAPSVDGQAKVIRSAQQAAGVTSDTITCVEAHGTGTALGDPIEVAALTQAFGAGAAKQYCALGSVKSNLGHLDAAAGVTGLIKAVLQLKHKELVPSLHYEQPNPKIDFANSPFYVNTKLQPWQPPQGVPRRAGVSSFGIGGTNAHVVLEEAPEREASSQSRDWQVITVSAKTATALDKACENLSAHLKATPEQPLADVAYTQQMGRTAYKQRRAVVGRTHEEAATALSGAGGRSYSGVVDGEREVAFLFPGQGAQYVGMGRELYEREEVFRRELDRCAEHLRPALDLDIRELLYGSAGKEAEAAEQLKQTRLTQPVLVAVEWALAEQWKSWGVKPEVMAGHSIGEYTAAVVAGVMELEDALSVVAARGRLMQSARPGAMLSVPLSENEVASYLREGLWLSTVNAPQLVVIGGDEKHVGELERELKAKGVEGKRLQTSHAFHTGMMYEVLERFGEEVAKARLRAPAGRYVSNLSGTWVTAEQATSARYWVEHLRGTVRFADNVKSLLDDGERVLLEVGPGSVLSALVRQQDKKAVAVNSLAGPQEKLGAGESMGRAVARLWVSGAKLDWSAYWGQEKRHRVSLPTYPFERQRYWIEPGKGVAGSARGSVVRQRLPIDDWFQVPTWKTSPGPELRRRGRESGKNSWLVFMDERAVAAEICKRLTARGDHVYSVYAGSAFSRRDDKSFTISLENPGDYQRLIQELKKTSGIPTKIAHFASLWGNINLKPEAALRSGFFSLLYLVQALGEQVGEEPRSIFVLSDRMHDVAGSEVVVPEQSTLLGPCRTIPLEYPHLRCRSIDIDVGDSGSPGTPLNVILEELMSDSSDDIVAYRGNRRWVQSFDPIQLAKPSPEALPFKTGGVYVITGGLGGIGLTIANYLASTWQANLVLIGRSSLPSRDQWANWQSMHGEHDSISHKITEILAMEAHGGRVLPFAADVCSESEMSAAWSAAVKVFGRVDGVIHAAGVAGGGMMQIKTPDMAEKVMAPKLQGTRVLVEVARNTPLDFFVLCSSITAVRSAFGQVDYCAANCYLDAVAQSHTIANCVSINWDAWQEVGMAVNTEMPPDLAAKRKLELRDAIRPAEGIDCLERILQTRLSQVLVSTMSAVQPVMGTTEAPTNTETPEREAALHPRPELRNQYVGPRNETDATILAIWQQLLGVEQIGIHDNFFELGGHSLLATQVASRLRESLKVEVPLRKLFEATTVAELSDSISASAPGSSKHKDAAAILAEIEQLSDEEAEQILAAEAQKAARAATK